MVFQKSYKKGFIFNFESRYTFDYLYVVLSGKVRAYDTDRKKVFSIKENQYFGLLTPLITKFDNLTFKVAKDNVAFPL